MKNYNRDEIINNIIEIGKRLGYKNYTPGYSGNISVRFNDNMIITTSGSSNGYLKVSDFVETDFNGNSLEEGKKPSSEKLLHIAFYKKRPDVNAIIHVHPAGLSAFASAGKDLLAPIMAENVFYFGGIPLAKYGMPSSADLVKNTEIFFEKYDAVLMANHGFIIGSSDLEDAYQKLEIAEEYAKTVIFSNIIAKPKILSNREAEKILALRTR